MTAPVPKPQSYLDLLATLKARIRDARLRAVVCVNLDLIMLYWATTFSCGKQKRVGGPLSSIAWPVTCGGIFPLSRRRNGRVGALVLDGGFLDA
jgi:hypothetical protein